jgi:hypothetical protein
MAKPLLITVGCVIVALCIMLAGQYAANILFPVTSDPAPPPNESPVSTSEIATVLLVRLYVPFWAPIAHVAACVIGALTGGFLAARLTPNVFWPVWSVAGVLGVWELLAVADIPKDIPFSVFAAATCVGGAWLGAIASQIGTRQSSE